MSLTDPSVANLPVMNAEARADVSPDGRQTRLFVGVVNRLPVCLLIDDRGPWDRDLSAGGMSIWLRYLGPTTASDR